MSIQYSRPGSIRLSMRTRRSLVLMSASAVVSAGLVARATVYTDAIGDRSGSAPPYVDIASVAMSNDASSLTLQINVNPAANFQTADGSQQYGKFIIGFDTQAGGSTALSGPTDWMKPMGISTGMDYWMGAWTNIANGTPPPAFFGYNVLEQWNGSDWQVTGGSGSNPFVDTPTTLTETSLTITIPLASLGLSAGSTFNFDVWSTFDGLQSAYDTAGQSVVAVADPWNGTAYDAAGHTLSYTVTSATTTATWTGTAGANWSNAGNWTGGVPNGQGHSATFGTIASGQFNVTVDSPQTVGTLSFDNATSYTVGGTSTLTMSATGAAAINVVSGSHSITAPVALSSDTTVTVTPAGSTLTVGSLQASTVGITKAGAGNLAVNNVRAGTLTVNTGTVSVLSSGTSTGTSKLSGALAIAGSGTLTGTLDLNDNDLIVGSGSPKAAIETFVRLARNNGGWNGHGITSSAARNLATTGLGVLSGSEYSSVGGTGTFSGQTYAAGDTLVKYTWNGDANFDGRVTFDDYVKIDTGFNTHLTGWLNGDFNYSGAVNFDDYVLIDIAFNQQNGTLGRAIDWISGDDRSTTGLDSAGLDEVLGHLNHFGSAYGAAFLSAVPEPTAILSLAPFVLSVRRRRLR